MSPHRNDNEVGGRGYRVKRDWPVGGMGGKDRTEEVKGSPSESRGTAKWKWAMATCRGGFVRGRRVWDQVIEIESGRRTRPD